eukprot:gene6052-6505_t
MSIYAVMEILNAITEKPDWQTKITDESIVLKWKEELQIQGISIAVIEKAIEFLRKFNTEETKYYNDSIYTWHIEIGADPMLWSGCQG